MLACTKMGQWEIGNSRELLNFVRKELCLHGSEGGIRGVDDGLCVELFAAAPFFCRITEEGNLDHGIKWTFSTFDLDRYCERIDPAGWDFKRYMDNPVVEWSHRYDIPAIGRADSLCADEKGLHGLVIFNSRDYDPFGWAIGERVKAGVIKAGSVGFRPIEIEVPNKETAKDGTSLIFRKQELLEFSICNVPANPWALAKALAFNKVDDRKQERELSPFWGNVIKN